VQEGARLRHLVRRQGGAGVERVCAVMDGIAVSPGSMRDRKRAWHKWDSAQERWSQET